MQATWFSGMDVTHALDRMDKDEMRKKLSHFRKRIHGNSCIPTGDCRRSVLYGVAAGVTCFVVITLFAFAVIEPNVIPEEAAMNGNTGDTVIVRTLREIEDNKNIVAPQNLLANNIPVQSGARTKRSIKKQPSPVTPTKTLPVTTGKTTPVTTGKVSPVTIRRTTPVTTGKTTSITAEMTSAVTTGMTTPVTTGKTSSFTTTKTSAVTTGKTTPVTTGKTATVTTEKTTPVTTTKTSPVTTGKTSPVTTGKASPVTTAKPPSVAAEKSVPVPPGRLSSTDKVRKSVQITTTLQPDIVVKLNMNTFDFVIDERSVCEESPLLTIYVLSAPGNFAQRSAIRSTWGDVAMLEKCDVKMVFMLGETLNKNISETVKNESNKYHDIIMVNVIDSQRNLTLKSAASLKWINLNCIQSKFILKTKDDMFLNIFKIVSYLRALQALDVDSGSFIIGYRIEKIAVIRQVNHKHFVSKSEYSDEFFPSFCLGIAYFMTPSAAKKLYTHSNGTQVIPVEDCFFTGIIRIKADVDILPLNSEFPYYTDVFLKLLTGQGDQGLVIPMSPFVTQQMIWKVFMTLHHSANTEARPGRMYLDNIPRMLQHQADNSARKLEFVK